MTRTKPLVLSAVDLSPRLLATLEPHCELSAASGRNCTYELALGEAPRVAGILSTPQFPIDKRLLEAADELKVVSIFGVGADHIDLPTAESRRVLVTNTAGANTEAVAELTVGFILVLGRQLLQAVELVRSGGWTRLDVAPVVAGISGSFLGVVGYGRIGRAVALRAKALGMSVLYHDIARIDAEGDGLATYAPLEELLSKSDFVSLHVNLDTSTYHLLNAERLALMRPSAYLINTSRGAVVDQVALLKALNERRIAGAGLDVLDIEPPIPDEPLLAHPDVIVLPHLAASTRSARRMMAEMAVQNLILGLVGEVPESVVVSPIHSAREMQR